MLIKDLISGEAIFYEDREQAIKVANERCAKHNAEFNYSHRGRHYSQNAQVYVYEYEIIIK